MLRKSKLLIAVGSLVIVLYGASAVFFGKDAYKELAVFMDVLQKILDEYVESPDMSKVHEGAMRGLLNALDPQSSFLTREQYENLQKRQTGAGAGIILSKRAEVVIVVSLEPDGVAATAGLRPGDYLMEVDGNSVEDKSIIEVDSLLHGAPGEKIKLTIFRDGDTKPRDFELVLQPPASVQANFKMMDGDIGYLQITSLRDASVEQVENGLKTLMASGVRRILLDLRNCADGSPANGAKVANFFLKSGVIYFSRNRHGEKIQVVEAAPEKFLTDLPMAILINSSTAGAAEIIAGALQDHNRARLVGTKSLGVGAEQKTLQLKSGAVLIISTAKYYTPNEKAIQDDTTIRKAGIDPDIKSPDNEKRQDLSVESYYDEQDDEGRYRRFRKKVEEIQLEKALEILRAAEEYEAPLKKAA